MTAPEDTVSALARRLDDAAQTRTDTPSLADEHTIDIDQAYRIQNELLERRTSRGESIVGIKLGFTSKAKMAQMGVSEVIIGQLTDAMCVSNGGEVDLRTFIHPKIEPEVAQNGGSKWSERRVSAFAGSWVIDGDHLDNRSRALAHHDHSVGEVECLIDIVGDHHRGGAEIGTDTGEKILHLQASEGIECREWFVQQKHLRMPDQRPGKGNTLRHAAGELMRIATGEIGETDALQPFPA